MMRTARSHNNSRRQNGRAARKNRRFGAEALAFALMLTVILVVGGCSSGGNTGLQPGPTFVLQSIAMEPTLPQGTRYAIEPTTTFHRGDIIAFRIPPNAAPGITGLDKLVKRIVGLPGETIEGRDGHIFINGRQLAEPYLPAGLKSTTFSPQKSPANSYFMLGDNRQFSNDSTHWGPANRNLFVGRVRVISK